MAECARRVILLVGAFERIPPVLSHISRNSQGPPIHSARAPMYSVHQVMVGKRDEMIDDLDRLGLEIDLIKSDLSEPNKNLSLSQREEKDKLLKMKRAQYAEKKKMPLWPVNSSLIKKFITSQAVPVLGLSGLGEPVMKLIKSLLDFINTLG